MATIKDVAKQAGVSVTLVSRYINHKKGVGKESAFRIAQAIDELHYQPNQLARSLVQGKTRTIAVLLDSLRNTLFFPLIQAVEEVAGEAGYDVVFLSSNGDAQRKMELFTTYTHGRVDGLMLYGGLPVLPQEAGLDVQGTALVTVDAELPGVTADAFAFDARKGAYLVTRSMLRDRKWVSLFAGDPGLTLTQEMQAGYEEAVLEFSNEDHIHVLPCGFEEGQGYGTMRRLLGKGICPQGVLAASDEAAYGVMKALLENGRRVPEDVAVAGFGGLGQGQDGKLPALTTVNRPMYAMAHEAARVLLDRIAQPGQPGETRKFEPEVMIRRSTRL